MQQDDSIHADQSRDATEKPAPGKDCGDSGGPPNTPKSGEAPAFNQPCTGNNGRRSSDETIASVIKPERTDWPSFLLLCSSALTLLVLAWTAFIFRSQLDVMNGQLTEMKSSSARTDRQISIYQGQLMAMNGQLSQMKSSSAQTDMLIGLYKRQADSMAKQASEAHNLAINSIETDRPWIGPWELTTSAPPLSGNPFILTLTIMNTGRRPAVNVNVRGASHAYDEFPTNPEYTIQDEYRRKSNLPTDEMSNEPLVPGSRLSTTWKLQAFDEALIKMIKERTITLYVYGQATYKDPLTRVEHETRICYRYVPVSESFDFCSFYNYMN